MRRYFSNAHSKNAVSVSAPDFCTSFETRSKKRILISATRAEDEEPPLIKLCSTRALLRTRSWPLEGATHFFLLVKIADVPTLLRALKYRETSTGLFLDNSTTSPAIFPFAFGNVVGISRTIGSRSWKMAAKDAVNFAENIGKPDEGTSHFCSASNSKTFGSSP